MPRRCPSCGREYDDARFADGATLWCTCGQRVGPEPRRRALASEPTPPFLADAMAGRLARWLRVLGFDCAYEAEIDDGDLVRRAVAEGRVILTRDRRLPEEWRVSHIVLLDSEDPVAQAIQVLRRFDLTGHVQLFSRCSECNHPLVPARAERVAEQVPERVRRRHAEFRECERCGRVYWPGSHTRRMRHVVDRILRDAGAESA